jgi:hypothetical protein
MFWERKLEHWVDHIRQNAALPLRLQLWNGRHFDFGMQAPEVTVTAAGGRPGQGSDSGGQRAGGPYAQG